METGTLQTLKHNKMLFVLMSRGVFLFPEREYRHFKQDREGYVCLKRKYLSEVADRDVEKTICIVCHEETELEDFVSPLCRKMHFVFCRACVEYLRKRTDRREVVCPYCKEKKSDKAYQEETRAVLFSLMSQQTLLSLELRPDTEVETVAEITRDTKIVLSNIAVTDALFFKLLSKTTVDIKNKISIVGHDNCFGRCIGEPGWRTNRQINIFFDGYTDEEMKQIYENTKTMPRKSIQLKAREIHVKENGICALLRLLDRADGYIPDLFLETSKREFIGEIAGIENNSICIENANRLVFTGYAIGILSKLRFHEESVIEELSLDAKYAREIAGIIKMKRNSLCIGRAKKLIFTGYAVGILPKLRLHGENQMKEIVLFADKPSYTPKILKEENNSIWIGKLEKLELKGYAVEILPKLRIHEDNVMEELGLHASYSSECITSILKTENNSIWVGKVKNIDLTWYAIEILPKLIIHEENVLEDLWLWTEYPKYPTEILKMDNNSIWVGKVNNLSLEDFAIQILPKLKLHGENVIEELVLWTDYHEHATEILRMDNNSIWVGKIKKLKIEECAIQILSKLKLHEENEIEELILNAYNPESIAGIIRIENNSIWVGKVKMLELRGHTLEILPKLRIHEENVLEGLASNADYPLHNTGILNMKNKSIWIGKVKKIDFEENIKEIENKLDFTLITPDGQEDNEDVV
ncbi:MAG: uncharacterized protein A8A55_2752 [Amphiamblys sp. WSBS2006]|nr:MAG: uncharacterized protein A8A55_2752 [Amphiamblys sp. WSBS2006]